MQGNVQKKVNTITRNVLQDLAKNNLFRIKRKHKLCLPLKTYDFSGNHLNAECNKAQLLLEQNCKGT